MAITKERNLFTITHEKMSAPVVFDVNTATISRRGKACTTTPAYSKQAVFDYVRSAENVPYSMVLLYKLACEGNIPMFRLTAYAPRFRMADKFDAVGYDLLNDYELSEMIRRGDDFEELDKNFKPFIKYHKQNPDTRYRDWKSHIHMEQLRQSYKFPNEYHVTPALEYFIEHHGDRYPEKYRSTIVYWLVRGVFNYFYDGTPTGRFSQSRWSENMADSFSRMLSMCEEMNIEPQKEEYFRQFGTVQQNYRVFRESSNTEQMRDYQQNAPLAFENDELIVVVPVTPTEFADEAQYQQNCVYSYYMPHVVKHETHVVFIRKKNDLNHPYITCEVDNRGHIIQYLTRYNNHVTDAVGQRFYEEYKNHLRQSW